MITSLPKVLLNSGCKTLLHKAISQLRKFSFVLLALCFLKATRVNAQITATPNPVAFSNICISSTAEQPVTINGTGLNAGDITLAALPGYDYSITAGGPYSTTLTFNQNGSFSQIIHIRFSPVTAGSYSGNILISGGNGSLNLPVTANGNALTGTTTFTAGALTVCQDAADETYTASAPNATTTYTVSPAAAGTINATSGVMNWDAGFSGTTTITATSTGTCGTTTADRVVTVNASTGATSFSSGSLTVCQDATDETYTATAANSTSIVYSLSPAAAGSINSATGLTNWDAAFSGTATITATSTGLCGTTSDTRVVTVNPTMVPAVSITANVPTTVCAGSSITFTAAPTNGGTYQWQISTIAVPAWNDIAGQTSSSFTSVFNTANNGDKFRVVMTSNAICPSPATATSNEMTVTVNPVLIPTVSISPAGTHLVCSTSSANFTSSAVNPGNSPVYQWQVSADNGNNWNNINGANSATYTGAFADNNQVRLMLTSDATCVSPTVAYSSVTTLSVAQPPTNANAGADQAICLATTTTATLAGNIISPGIGTWTVVSSTGSTPSITSPNSPNSTVTNLALAGVYVFQWTASSGACASNSDQVTITVTPSAAGANAGPDQVVCGLTTTNLVATAVSNPSSGVWSLVSGPAGSTIFAPGSAGSGFSGAYGSTYVLRWTVTNAACSNYDDVQVTFVALPTPTITAAPATAVCINSTVTYTTQSGAGINNYTWNLPGVAGTDYNITAGGIGNASNTVTVQWLTAGSMNVRVNYKNASNCAGAAAASTSTTVNTTPSISLSSGAGTNNKNICGTGSMTDITFAVTGSTAVSVSPLPAGLSGSLVGSTFTISKTGSVAAGTYNYTVTAVALPGCSGSATATGSITVFTGNPGFPGNTQITGPNGHCPTGQITLTVNAASNTQFYRWYVEGNELPANGWIIISGAGTSSITIQSTGTVSYANNANTFSVRAENPCGIDQINASKNLDLNVSTFNGVTAGNDFTICQGTTINLSGTLQGAATTGTWTLISGTGTLGTSTTAATTVNASFTPAFGSGTATLRLTSNDASGTCNVAVSDEMIVTVIPTPTANFGSTITVCESTSGTLTINGTPNTVVNYTKVGVAQTPVTIGAGGSATISTGVLSTNTVFELTSVGYSAAPNCTQSITAGITVTVNPKAIVNAGSDISACGNIGSVQLSGGYSGSATSAIWSGGSGGFSPNNSALNAIYTPTPAEVTAGSVNLYLTATAGFLTPCQASQDTVTISLFPAPTVSAGADKEKCGSPVPTAISLSDATRGGSSTVARWFIIAGSGTLSSTSFNANPGTISFTPAANFSGEVKLRLVTDDPASVACGPIDDTVSITITPMPTVDVGTDITVCSNSTVPATATLGGTATSGSWTSSGNGLFSNATSANTIYTLGSSDIANSSVTLTFTSNDPAGTCTAVSDAFTIAIKDSVHISSNPVNVGLCAGSNASFTAVASGDDLVYQWYKGNAPSGVAVTNAGNISGATTAQLSFSPALAANGGSYYLVVSANNANCAAKTSAAATLNVDESIVINTQPTAQTVCENAPVSFTVTATAGTDVLSYQWRRNGVNITGAINATYTTAATLAIQGNYDVIVSGSAAYTCPNITSSAVALTVTPTVGTPTAITVAAGTEPTCQLTNATTTTTYATTATTSTGFNWSLSNAAAGSINAATGVMIWANGFAGSVNIQVTANGCSGPSTQVIRTVSLTPTVGAPSVITVGSGTEPTCQLTNGTTTTTYATTATNNTGFNWSLSNAAAGSINTATGVMTWANDFSGSVDIRVTASGCSGPSAQATRTVTVTPTVGTPTAITIAAGSQPTCQLTNGTTTTTYATTAANSTSFNWSLSNAAAGTIDPSTGVMTWANGFFGTVDIQITAAGCNGPSAQVTRPVTVISTIGTPVFAAGATSARCQGAGSATYTATAPGSTSISYTLDANSLAAGNSIIAPTGAVSFAAGWSGTSTITATAQGCNGPTSSAHTVNISVPSTGGTVYLDGVSGNKLRTGCPFISGTMQLEANSYTGTVIGWQSSTNAGGTWAFTPTNATQFPYTSVIATTTYRAVVKNGPCDSAFSTTVLVSVIPPAIPGATATPQSICLGDTSILQGTTGYANDWPSGIDGTFNRANPAGWRIHNGTEFINFPANADNGVTNPWSETNGPKQFFDPAPYAVTYNNISPAGIDGKFAVSTGAIRTTMETPIFGTIGLTTAALTFSQAFVLSPGSAARIEISLDGGNTYSTTPLMQWAGPLSVGTPASSWVPLNINLDNYLGQPSVRIRFVSDFIPGPTLSTWAIDGVGFPSATVPVTYVWTPTGTGTSTGGPIPVSPSTTTLYTLTSYIGSCYGGEDTVTVNVNPRASIIADAVAPGICTSTTAQATTLGYGGALNNPTTYSITWLATPANTFATVNDAALPAGNIEISIPANTVAGTYKGVISVANSFGCRAPGDTFSITINPRPVVTPVTPGPICDDSSPNITLAADIASNFTWTVGTITGSITGASGGSGSLINQILSNDGSTTGTVEYIVTPTAVTGGCAGAPYTITVTVNSPASITAQPLSTKACVGSSITITSGSANATNFKWQRKTLTGPWTDIDATMDGGIYSTFTTNTLTIAANISITSLIPLIDNLYRVEVGNSCNSLLSTTATLQFNYVWTGNVSNDWNNINNWLAKEIPTTSCPNVYLVGDRPNEPRLSTATPPMITNLHILQNADFTLANGDGVGTGTKLMVAGHITRYPTSTFEALDGTLEMSGTVQNIDANTFNRDDLENLIVSSSGNLALDGPVDIFESVTFGSTGVNLATNGHLTLKSLASRTARLGTLNTPAQTVTGEATVERYLRPRMAWRFLAVPTSGNQTTRQSWQENGNNTITEYGTEVTGPVVANGIDAYTINPSMKAFNSSTFLWDGVSNTNTKIEEPRGYMLFVRGDRSSFAPQCETCPQPVVKETTLRTKGNFYKGMQLFDLPTGNGWLSVGNPYASQIDLRLTAKTGEFVNAVTIWDSYPLGAYWVGAYQTLVYDGANYINMTTGQAQNHIESGQAFFIQSGPAGAANLAIRETDKTDGSENVSFAPPRTTKPEVTIWAKLVSAANGQTPSVADGLLLNFENNYSQDIDKMDVKKFFSAGNNLSVLSKGYYLVAERSPYPKAADSIELILSSTSQQGYRLDFEPTNLQKLSVKPLLYDRYLNTYYPISATGTTSVSFTITGDAGSRALNRFKIVFKKAVTPELQITLTDAMRNADRTIVVNWSAANEQEIEKYEVERSADGRLFSGIITTLSAKNEMLTLYSKTDLGPLAGDNYYRIKATRKDGVLVFSDVIKVAALPAPAFDGKGMIAVYPNPVTGKRMNIRLANQETGKYQLQLINTLGQVVFSNEVSVDGNDNKRQVQLGSSVTPGQYKLSITAPSGEKTTQTIFVE